MMSSSSDLLARVRDFVARGGEADERVDSLILRGPLPDAATQASWLSLVPALTGTPFSVQLYNTAIGGDLSTDDAFDPARDIVITIGKPQIAGVACFFFQDRLADYWRATAITPCLVLADLDLQGAFTSRGLKVGPWNLDAPLAAMTAATPIDPTAFVRDFVPTREITTDVAPWLVMAPPARPSPAFASWKTMASRRLLGSLVSSAWMDNDVVWLQAAGPPLYRVRADDTSIVEAFDTLTNAAQWVFLSGQDIEARHIIFASELARANRPDQTLPQTITRALEAAKATYEAHVQSASRETLKALGDLRKTVIDETQKVTQKTQDLTAGLWRDLAVTAAPFVLKILGDAGKVGDHIVAAGFYFAAAIFIALSFILQWRINGAFFSGQSASRATWMQTLYNYISAREREEIADAPIARALENYRETRAILAVVYALLFAILIGFGVATLRQHAQAMRSDPAHTVAHVVPIGPRQTRNAPPHAKPGCGPTGKAPCAKAQP